MKSLFRGASRLIMALAFVLILPTCVSFAGQMAMGRVPTTGSWLAVALSVALLGLAAGLWWWANRIEDERRRRESPDGIDRNPRRGF